MLAIVPIRRCDARIPLSLDDAIERGHAYAAGADLVLLEILQSEDEMRCAAKATH